MSKSRSASVKSERNGSATPESSTIKFDEDHVVRLFEDSSLVVEEHVTVKGEGDYDGDYDIKEEDSTTMVADPSSSRSASADAKSPLSPEVGGDDRPSLTPPSDTKAKAKKGKPEPQLIGDLPRAEEAAMKTFVEIKDNHYQYGTLGRSREFQESMTCDCQYEHGVDDPDDACGHDSDCINRLTQVECLSDDCRCGSYCQNQRFQRKQYAPIHIVQTEKKGFGLRAAEDIRKDTFIYEYVGDVVSQPSFLKRMRQYAEEGIRHFYFMMLQKDEYIDATKRGGIGRFANHSCNPNCYVDKWTVGPKIRMGIFATRDIKKDEELTFNYNVDRYGHDAQPCYCGEAKCVGFIGGKTQTDLAAMDDLYLDALGITDEVEKLGLKGSKKRKGKKLDEDYVPDLKPLTLKDVPKVVQAMRQTQSRKVLLKLLTRVKLTEDQSALRQIMRLRGFGVMNNVLGDYVNDVEICSLAIECMATWPLIQRNKVEDSKVNISVKVCSESENVVLAELATKLLAQWDALEYAYRIPKRLKGEDGQDTKPPSSMPLYDEHEDWRPPKRARFYLDDDPKLDIKPLGRFGGTKLQMPAYVPSNVQGELEKLQNRRNTFTADEMRTRLDRIIAEASAAAEAERVRVADEAAAAATAAEAAAQKKASSKKKMTAEEKEALKEKRLLKLVGAVVVKCMSKYQKEMDHELFKKHAKELTHIVAEKEKKSHNYKENKLDALSDEKVAKIKKFSKEYIAKILRKLEKSGQRRKPSSSISNLGASTSSTHSPQVDANSPHQMNDHDGDDTPDDAMDVDHAIDGDRRNGSDPTDSPNDSAYVSWAATDKRDSDRPDSYASHGRHSRDNARTPSPRAERDHDRADNVADAGHERDRDDFDAHWEHRSRSDSHRTGSESRHHDSGWRDPRGDPRKRHRNEESGWDPDHGARRSLLERIQL